MTRDSRTLTDYRTQSGALWRIEGEKRAKKMRQDDGAEFIRASLRVAEVIEAAAIVVPA